MSSSTAGRTIVRIFFEQLRSVDMPTVDADDRLIEALWARRTSTDGGELGALLAAWRDDCAARAIGHAC